MFVMQKLDKSNLCLMHIMGKRELFQAT